MVISSYGPHFGEEAPLVGRHGSGTIFFTYCNLQCVFCQNYTISQLGEGRTVDREALAGMLLSLQAQGCHNINLVSPTHVVSFIVDALELAVSKGFYLPLVYNSGGYDSVETLKLLDGIVDIYLPDMRYSDKKEAKKYSSAPDYPSYNKQSIKEMYRQVGTAQIGEGGIIKKGMIIRHLVLPNKISGTEKIMKFISEEIPLIILSYDL